MSAHDALDQYLSYLGHHLSDEAVTEVCVNRVGEMFVEKGGVMERFECPDLTYKRLRLLVNQVAQHSLQPVVTDQYPLVAATLPGGERIQCVLPPATEQGQVALSIRKQIIKHLSLDDYAKRGGYERTRLAQQISNHENEHLLELYRRELFHDFIKEAIRKKLTILIIGGTSSGKTVFLNACLAEIPMHERIITIEDVREVEVVQPNSLSLLYPRQGEGSALHTAKDLVEVSLRMRPDRLLLGEIRGAEAFDFLHAINTGHPGSIATLHANSPQGALKRLGMMVLQANTRMTLTEIDTYVRRTVDVIVQVARTGVDAFGVREVYYADALDDI